jgi:hypothetical protein
MNHTLNHKYRPLSKDCLPAVICTALMVLFLSAGITTAYALQSGVLRVVALSESDGNPLAGANVLLYEPDGREQNEEPVHFCVTDRDGFCEIRNLPAGQEFELVVSFIGYLTFSDKISLEPGDRLVLRVELQTEVGEFEELLVQEQRQITTGEVGVHRITNIDISRVPSPVAGGDLATYLQTMPGIVSTGDRGGELFIRGGTPDQNLVLVDKLPIIKPFHISNLFSAFSDDVVQSVDLFAGGFDATYTGATSAVIDVALRPGNMRNFRASGAASPYLVSLHAEGPLQLDRQSFLVKGRTSTIEQFGPTLTGQDIPIRFSDLVSRYTFMGDNINCNLTGVFTQDRGEIVPDRNLDHTWSNTVIGGRCLGYSDFFNHPLDISAGYTAYRNSEASQEQTERFSSIWQIYINTDLQHEIGSLPVDFGFGVNIRTYDIELSERVRQFVSYEPLNRTIPIAHIYANLEWAPHRTLTLQPGFVSQFTLDTPITFEPRLRLSWQPDGTDRTQLSLAGGRYVQTHSGITDERDAGTVFTVLKPVETGEPLPESWHGIIAWQQRAGYSFTANIEAFIKTHQNIPVSKWTPEARLDIETALADGLTYGFDIRFRFDRPRFFSSVGYGWTKVNYEAVTGDLGAWIEETIFSYNPAHDQRHKVNAIGSYRFAGITASASWEFGTGAPYTRIFGFDYTLRVPIEEPQTDPGTARILFSRPYGDRLPAYHRLDISLERSFRIAAASELEISAGVINVYNRNNIFNFDIATLQRVDQTPLLPYMSIKLSI